jgi:hypothetical protein
MTPPQPPIDSEDPRSGLSGLAERISQANAKDQESQEVLDDLIQGYRAQIAARHQRLIGCMDAASSLVHSLSSLDDETAREVQEVAARVLEVVNQASARDQSLDLETREQQKSPSTRVERRASMVRQSASGPSPQRRTSDAGLQTLNDMALCELLVQLGIVSQAQVDKAMVDSTKTGRAVEDSLYAIGAVGPEDVFRAMKLQKALSTGTKTEGAPEVGRARQLHAILLGEILVASGNITRSQLEEALEHQRSAGVRLGEALVDLKFASWEDVAEAVRTQEERGGSSERNTDATVIRLD